MSLASRKLIQAAAKAGAPSDDDFANVVLLLDGDGTSGDDNETFTDSSTNGYTVTESGSVVQGSFSPYNDNWSNYFDGSSYLSVPDSTDFDFGTGDFTWEAWIRTTVNVNYQGVLGSYFSGSATWGINTNSSGTITYFTAGTTLYTGSTVVTDGGWHHIAVSRSGTSIRLFVDGVQDGSTGTNSTNIANSAEVRIGSLSSGLSRYFTGYISNVRVIKGTALYTSAFTPSTSPLTAVTNTQLLISQSNRFVDNSSSSRTVTVGGTPKVTPFSPFKDDDARGITTDGGSGYFGGSSDYLTVSSSFSIGTNSFTWEAWVWCEDGTSQQMFCGASGGMWIGMNIDSANRFSYGTQPSGTLAIAAYTWPTNEWIHLAIVRDGSTVQMYANGVALSMTDSSDSTDLGSPTFEIGREPSAKYFSGYVSDFRFVIGSTVYTSAFTPPTSPLTAITNTELLLNFQDAGIYDRSGINNLDTVGNAQIDTAVKKYGTGSMEFDGTGDYLDTVSTEALTFGTGDFTIEFWINTSNNGNIMNPSTATGTGYWGLLMQSGNLRWNSAYGVTNLWEISASAIQDGSWHHVAISRASGSARIFYDGTLQSTQSDTTNYSGTGAWRIGSGNLSAFNGYLDDLRITKGVARYTTSFTLPTAALPKF